MQGAFYASPLPGTNNGRTAIRQAQQLLVGVSDPATATKTRKPVVTMIIVRLYFPPCDACSSRSIVRRQHHRSVVGMLGLLILWILVIPVQFETPWTIQQTLQDAISLPRIPMTGSIHSTPYSWPGQTRPYFSNPDRLSDLVHTIGPHFLHTGSGCRMAVWFLSATPGGPPRRLYDDCGRSRADQSQQLTPLNIHTVQAFDTIYVTFMEVPNFVTTLLDQLTVPVVMISGQTQNVIPPPYPIVGQLLNNSNVLAWFCQNVPVYGGADLEHPKLMPFPYGLDDVKAFQKIFMETLDEDTLYRSKNRTIYSGPLKMTSATRKAMFAKNNDSPPYLPIDDFLRRLAQSRYILSPNGDRPECYRHYESIGLGAIPITELDAVRFSHLKGAPVVFGTKDWNVTRLEHESLHWWDNEDAITMTTTNTPRLNRNLVFEEYWMEYVDWHVGRALRWWNLKTRQVMFVSSLFQMDYIE